MNFEKEIIDVININPINSKYAICFSIDDEYAKYFSVVLQSFISVSNKNLNYDVIVLFNDLSDENMSKLTSNLASNISLRFYNVQEIKNQFIEQDKFKPKDYWSECIYFRLLIPEIFKNYEKVLYCDSDIIFNHNIDEIFSINTDNKCLLATRDSIVPELNYNSKRKQFIEKDLGIQKSDGYFNSGVLLFNIANIDNKKYLESLIINLNKHKKLKFPDQDILNIIFQDKVIYLSQKWNFQVNIPIYQQKNLQNYDKTFLDDYYKSLQSPFIIHYAGDVKPWHNPGFIFYDIFWQHARNSSYYEEIILSNINEKNYLMINKNILKFNYLKAKVLSQITFGNIRKKYQNEKNFLKVKIKKIRNIMKSEL